MPNKPEIQKDAERDYKFLQNHDLNVLVSPKENAGFAETYPKGETGSPEEPRPNQFPIDQIGIEIRRPDKFTKHDLAAEVLHDDPVANRTREELKASFTPEQLDALKRTAGDYQFTIAEGPKKGIEERAINNATDSLLRAYTVGQWESMQKVKDIGLNQEQIDKLKNLHYYMVHGEDKMAPQPSKFRGILAPTENISLPESE